MKAFYALVKNNHIYSRNHDFKSIQQKTSNDIPTVKVKASTDYNNYNNNNNREAPRDYKMIADVSENLEQTTRRRPDRNLLDP